MPTSARRSSASAKGTPASQVNAIALLKADHRQVEEWFEQFGKSRSDQKKAALAEQICQSLTAHMTIEEEIFYPAYIAETGDQDLHHEAEIEHNGAKNLIAQIEASNPTDEYFDSMVKVLSEMIKHHVKEEEQTDGMFSRAKKSEMDLAMLGEQMAERKEDLLAGEQKKAPAKRRAA